LPDEQLVAAQVHEGARAQEQLAAIERLAEEIVCSGREALVPIVLIVQRGEEDDGQQRFVRLDLIRRQTS